MYQIFSKATRAQKSAACVTVLLLLNIYVARELFTIPYTRHMGSIEGSYIAISRYLIEHGVNLSWFPLWYVGTPFQNSYPPLLGLLVAGFSVVFKIPPELSYHAVIAAVYCLGSATFFWLAYRLSGLLSYSFLAGLLYSTISPASFLIQAVRADAAGLWNPRRLQVMVAYGEGPHILSTVLLPVAIIALDTALTKRKAGWYLMSAVTMAAVVLANWLGAFAFAAAALCYLFCSRTNKRVWLVTAALAIYSYLLVCPWIPPSTILAVRRDAQIVGGNFPITPQVLTYWAPYLGGVAILWYVLRRLCASRAFTFSALFLWLIGYITLAWYWAGVYLLPQPHRYQVELEMAVILSAIFGARTVFDAKRSGKSLRIAIACLCLLLAARGLIRYRNSARGIDAPIEIHATSEYRMANWLDRNMNGARVFVPGSISYWLNAFTNTPQLGGGFDQGVINPMILPVIFQLYSGMNAGAREGEIAATWLKAFGVRAVGVTGPGSTEAFKPFTNPHKFDGLLPVLWRNGDDVIYAVSEKSGSLAHVIKRSDAIGHPPETAIDTAAVGKYVAALDDPSASAAEFAWEGTRGGRITAVLHNSDLLSVQVNYNAGWHARVEGRACRIFSDGLGLILIEPECDGRCTVELEYDGGAEMKIAQIASLGSIASGLIWLLLSAVRKKANGGGRVESERLSF